MISLILSENHIHYAQWETLSGSQSIDLVGSLPLKTPLSEFKPGTEELTAMSSPQSTSLPIIPDEILKRYPELFK